jgi:putative transposase
MAVNRQFPDGARGHGWSLMSEKGCQPTARLFMKACRTLGIQQAFTSDNHPKANADTERVMRTLKEECLWLSEWTSPFALNRALADWVISYTEQYPHSSLGYRTPRQFEVEYQRSHSSPFVAA